MSEADDSWLEMAYEDRFRVDGEENGYNPEDDIWYDDLDEEEDEDD